MQCLGWRMEEEAKRRQHRDDAIGDPGPRRLPLGRRRGFATRGRQVNSRAATRDCGQRTSAAVLRSCAAVSPLSSSAPLKGLSAPPFCRRCLGGSLCAPRVLMVAVIVVNDAWPLRYRNCCPSGCRRPGRRYRVGAVSRTCPERVETRSSRRFSPHGSLRAFVPRGENSCLADRVISRSARSLSESRGSNCRAGR